MHSYIRRNRAGHRWGCTRRVFLEWGGWCVAALALPGCASLSRRPAGRGDFTFVQLCDPQLGMGGYDQDVARLTRAVDRINGLRPDFVVVCGDFVHDATPASFADYLSIMDGLDVPWHGVPGNHDVGNEPTPERLGYYREVIGEDYGTFLHRGYRFVLVNTQLWKAPLEGESARQDAWLTQTLERAAADGSPVIVVGHYPLFLAASDEPEEYMNLPVAKRNELLELFGRCGVVAFLGGHAHRLLVNEYRGIQMVHGETTSKNFDKRPFGFRTWQVAGDGSIRHTLVLLDDDGKDAE